MSATLRGGRRRNIVELLCVMRRLRGWGAPLRNTCQRIGKISWLGELENISVGHGVSLLCWRSGGVEHPHDTPPYPFMPSPTSAHSSLRGIEWVNKGLKARESCAFPSDFG